MYFCKPYKKGSRFNYIVVKKILSKSLLILFVSILAVTSYAQNTVWRCAFVGQEITATNYNKPFELLDTNGGPLFMEAHFSAQWANGTPYFGGSPNHLQVGSADNPVDFFTLSLITRLGTIKRVKIGTCGASNIHGTIQISIGDSILTKEQLQENADSYVEVSLTDGLDAPVNFYFEQWGQGKAIFLFYIEIEYIPATDAIITIGESGYTTFSYRESLDFSQVTDASGEPAEITAYSIPVVMLKDKTVGIKKCGGNSISEDRTVRYNTGLLIKGEPGIYHVKCIDTDANRFVSLLVPISMTSNIPPSDGTHTFFMLQGDKFVRIPEDGVDFGLNTACLGVLNFMLDDYPVEEFSMVEVSDESDIKSILQPEQPNEWFTITGSKVNIPSIKGIYIHNNRKVVVK